MDTLVLKQRTIPVNGWYDNDGNQITIPSKYEIEDMKDDKVILQTMETENEDDYTIIDLTGKILLRTTAFKVHDNVYLVKNTNHKMVLMNPDFKAISKEYDRIVTDRDVDIDVNFSSYYK